MALQLPALSHPRIVAPTGLNGETSRQAAAEREARGTVEKVSEALVTFPVACFQLWLTEVFQGCSEVY